MAIAVDQNYDKAQRKISTANLGQFAGVDCQLLVEKETHRPIIMDGTTIGGKFKCASTDELEAVKTVANNAISQAYADEHYLGKTAKAVSAGTADTAGTAGSATKATQDANGNTITSTYATKTEVTSGLSGKLGKTEKASSASTADAVAWTGISGKPSFATVATSGSYNDLKNKPSIPTSPNAYIIASSITNTQQAIKFSNGLIMMSGQGTGGGSTYVTITFPYAFTSTAYNIFCFPASVRPGSNNTSYPIVAHSTMKYESSCRLKVNSSDGADMPSVFWWFAIGK